MFKPGDKVVCIREFVSSVASATLKKGEIYTVLTAGFCDYLRDDMVILKEKQRRSSSGGSIFMDNGYFASRFMLSPQPLTEQDYYKWLANR